MRKALYFAAAIAAAAVSVSSCLKDDTLSYSVTEMCTVQNGGRFISDEGYVFNVAEKQTTANPDTLKRIFILCDVLRETANATNEYDIRLKDYAPVRVAAIQSSESPASFGADGANVNSAWMRNGYINIQYSYTILADSKTAHSIRLVYDELKSSADTARFYLSHDSKGESFNNAELDGKNFQLVSEYASFEVDALIPRNSSRLVELYWQWYGEDGGAYTRDLTDHYGYIRYPKSTE